MRSDMKAIDQSVKVSKKDAEYTRVLKYTSRVIIYWHRELEG
jgi:hypothetical protein